MEIKGTKGKWEAYKPEHIGCYNVALGEANGFNGYVELWHHHYENAKEAESNALLISKAPEMLEILKELVALHEMMVGDEGTTTIKAKQLIKEATEINP